MAFQNPQNIQNQPGQGQAPQLGQPPMLPTDQQGYYDPGAGVNSAFPMPSFQMPNQQQQTPQNGNQQTSIPPKFNGDPAALANAYAELERAYTTTSQQNSVLTQQMEAANIQTQTSAELLEKVLQRLDQPGHQNQGPDYTQMSDNQLINLMVGDPEKGESPNVRGILNAFVSSATRDIEAKYNKSLEEMRGDVDAMRKQHSTLQAAASVRNLENKYAHDKNFKENMAEAGRQIATPEGKLLVQQFPDTALEKLYLMQVAQKIMDPAFQQQLATQAMNMQNQQNIQKMQAGMGNFDQNQVPITNQPQPPGGKTDLQVLHEILSHDGSFGQNFMYR